MPPSALSNEINCIHFTLIFKYQAYRAGLGIWIVQCEIRWGYYWVTAAIFELELHRLSSSYAHVQQGMGKVWFSYGIIFWQW